MGFFGICFVSTSWCPVLAGKTRNRNEHNKKKPPKRKTNGGIIFVVKRRQCSRKRDFLKFVFVFTCRVDRVVDIATRHFLSSLFIDPVSLPTLLKIKRERYKRKSNQFLEPESKRVNHYLKKGRIRQKDVRLWAKLSASNLAAAMCFCRFGVLSCRIGSLTKSSSTPTLTSGNSHLPVMLS